MNEFVSNLEAALELHHPFRTRLLKRGVPAAVLLLFAQDGDGAARLLFTRRTLRVETHKGQIAFPGGMTDAEDLKMGGAEATALRETFEEVGIEPGKLRTLGRLPRLPTSTGFLVTPVVAVSTESCERLETRLNPHEVDSTFWVGWQQLMLPGVYRREFRFVADYRLATHSYRVGEDRIWGVTGAIVRNLAERWTRVAQKQKTATGSAAAV